MLISNWDRMNSNKYRDEHTAIAALKASDPLSCDARTAILREAIQLVRSARQSAQNQGVVESFLQEFSLSTREGLALMSLAEALLRTPDTATKDRLITERISAADWASHLGQSESSLVNASTWGLVLLSKFGDRDDSRNLRSILMRLIGRMGEPVVRLAVGKAIRIMGEQFVLGATIESAMSRADREGLLCSFDMLGEGARTVEDAERYEKAYAAAIAILSTSAPKNAAPESFHGISVKLSALSPRYEATQENRAWNELYPRILRLAQAAAAANLNFTLDAEEADRLVLSLKFLDRLVQERALAGWSGLGLAVQAYQKRAQGVVESVAALAQASGRRLMVRLVKGAYWDSEIKRAQIGGRSDYPVFTTKAATDLSYLVCARALIGASPAVYAQFATHNAHTLAAVKAMADEAKVKIEFQRLHGMGEALYGAASQSCAGLVVRTYAPVGPHEDLLPYLVRRLLENGANTSFVYQLMDDDTPPEQVARDPICDLEVAGSDRHPHIPTPINLYGDRRNSFGLDLSEEIPRSSLKTALDSLDQLPLQGYPIISGAVEEQGPRIPVQNPFNPDITLGHTGEASTQQIAAAVFAAKSAQTIWDRKGGPARANILNAMADILESEGLPLAALCVREAGKTWPDAIAEVREAVDFCRYYALLARRDFGDSQILKGPAGESNVLGLRGRGVFVCISPWNFPLAIFTGQVAAALAAGNAVLAKPAEQTPLIAAQAVRLFHKAGLDPDLLHLLPGRGEIVGAALVANPGIAGVAFTGGTTTAKSINRILAEREGAIIPFIAETGGLNAMFVDTTAQREQVIDDVIVSAFGSAGQRCSALRLLFLPEETADGLLAGIAGAMDTLVVGNPASFETDIGPVIDAAAKDVLLRHMAKLQSEAEVIKRAPLTEFAHLLFAPALVEIKLEQLPDREVFGPILHVVRYRSADLERVAKMLAAKGYGLTLGIHSRIEAFARQVQELVPAGNVYINRSIIGAVVGVQPFGGEGLSGTGPKAGGPFALTRYAVERAVSTNTAAQGGDPVLLSL